MLSWTFDPASRRYLARAPDGRVFEVEEYPGRRRRWFELRYGEESLGSFETLAAAKNEAERLVEDGS